MTGSRRRRRFKGTRLYGHPAMIIAFISVVLSLFGPALTASAQLEGEATPVIEQTAQGTEPPVLTPTETDTAVPDAGDGGFGIQAVEPGFVAVTVRACRGAVDPAASYSELAAACTVALDGQRASLLDLNGPQTVSLGASASGSFAGVVLFADGSFQATVPLPALGVEASVHCTEAGSGAYAPVGDTAGEIVYFPSVTSGFDVSCTWFLIAPPAGPGDLVVQLKTCPVGFDLATDWLGDCSVLADGIGFTLSGEGVTQTGTTGDDGPGRTRFEALAPGTYEVTQATPGGMASTFVWGCFVLDGASVAPSEPLSYGNVLTHTMDPGESYLCEWYNIPGDDGGENETGTVRVSKYTCPEGVSASDDDYLLSEQCREDVAPVSFEVSDSAGADLPLTLNAGVPQNGEISGLAFGTIWIAEIVPDGYGAPLVFCSDTPSDGAGNYEPVPVHGGNAAEVELRADAEMPLTCLFFNFPGGDDDGETGTVHVSKYTCPAGVDRSDDDYILSETCRESIDPVSFTLIATAGGYERTEVATAGVPQSATFTDVPFGEIALEEAVPPGYEHPLVFCADTAADGPGAYEPVEPWPESGAFIIEHRADAEIDLSCIFFNFLDDDDPGNTVTVNKYVCPSWVNPETDTLLDVCAPGGDGIPFTFVDGSGMHPAPISGGSVTWTNVVIGTEGELQIIEDIPAGYSDPWVVCDGILMASTNGFVVPNPGDARPFHIACDWFNFALEDAALAVVKHGCEPGYDLHAAGADPMVDCPELTDGVEFRIVGMGADMTSTTGDAGSGTVQFGGLDPGAYTLTETVPGGTATSFVLDCYGNDLGAVRPYPLATGDTLDLTLHAGEEVTCHWFNVPQMEGGGLTVIKYLCAGESFASDVDCEVYEDGVTFDLAMRQDGRWVEVATATTDDHGRIAWTGLEPGRYWLGEQGDAWCHIASAQLTDELTGIIVEDGEAAVVKVYNCGAEPGKPGETPTKFPDTGVPPAGAGSSGGATYPAAAFAALLALPLTRRRLAAMAVAVPAAGMVGHALAQEGDQVIEPTDGTAGPQVVSESLCLPTSDAGCERGPVPASLRIDAIGVDAQVEILETVAGEMQQPSDAQQVAWYKETARLGEPGNMLLAGHLNWWGVPEAVFYNLARLQAGDEIRIAGNDGEASRYAVEWVRHLPGGEAPGDDVLGMTAWPAATLITCAGAWDAAASSYEDRAVVRARLIDD